MTIIFNSLLNSRSLDDQFIKVNVLLKYWISVWIFTISKYCSDKGYCSEEDSCHVSSGTRFYCSWGYALFTTIYTNSIRLINSDPQIHSVFKCSAAVFCMNIKSLNDLFRSPAPLSSKDWGKSKWYSEQDAICQVINDFVDVFDSPKHWKKYEWVNLLNLLHFYTWRYLTAHFSLLWDANILSQLHADYCYKTPELAKMLSTQHLLFRHIK